MPTSSPIFTRTRDFIKLYVHAAGKSEIPVAYHFWSAMSLIAATVKDNVWLETVKEERIIPNLYIMLVGPSGIGKGLAMRQALRYYNSANANPNRDAYYGKATAAHLIDRMGRESDPETGEVLVPKPKMWVIMDELKEDIGTGRQADDFIGLMTKLYTYTGQDTVNTGTRTKGEVKIVGPTVNWFSGTTEEWLLDSLTNEVIGAGFAARIVYVMEDYCKERYVRTEYPPDWDQVREHLLIRLWMLSKLKGGKFYVTPKALAREHTWYMNRKLPRDKSLRPHWERDQVLVLKLAMIYVLSDGVPSGQLVIDEPHMARAIATVESLRKALPRLVAIAKKSSEASTYEAMEEMLNDLDRDPKAIEGYLPHSVLMNRARSRGIPTRVAMDCLTQFKEDGKIEWRRVPGRGREYRWAGEKTS